jgi:hypothetical protein
MRAHFYILYSLPSTLGCRCISFLPQPLMLDDASREDFVVISRKMSALTRQHFSPHFHLAG